MTHNSWISGLILLPPLLLKWSRPNFAKSSSKSSNTSKACSFWPRTWSNPWTKLLNQEYHIQSNSTNSRALNEEKSGQISSTILKCFGHTNKNFLLKSISGPKLKLMVDKSEMWFPWRRIWRRVMKIVGGWLVSILRNFWMWQSNSVVTIRRARKRRRGRN